MAALKQFDIDNIKIKYPYELQFFAKDGPGGEKTEEPTTKKLEDARKEGQVARSQELLTAVSLMALFLILKVFAGYMGNSFISAFKEYYSLIPTTASEQATTQYFSALLRNVGKNILVIAIPVYIAGIVVSIVINIFQVKWKVTGKPLQPKFSKINPISGFKKIFSLDKIFELVKSVLKIIAIAAVVYTTLKNYQYMMYTLYDIDLIPAIVLIGDIIINLGIKISAVFLVIGIVDYIYQKIKFKKDMRMTKQEIKDEYKQTEGDPQIKGRIKQKMREASQRRMMQRLPEADVVITNPTHFACAILYDKEKSEAPVLVAKGADYVAAKIKEAAKEYNIPIVENRPLARMLYYNVDLEQEIPEELYQMTAEVLAYVYNLKNKV